MVAVPRRRVNPAPGPPAVRYNAPGPSRKCHVGRREAMPWTTRLGILDALAAAVTSGAALAVDRFGWEVELTLWLQGFSIGPFEFLRGWMFWMGRERRGGRRDACGLRDPVAKAMAVGVGIRGDGVRAGPSEPRPQGGDWAASADGGPGGRDDRLGRHTGGRLPKRPRGACGAALRLPAVPGAAVRAAQAGGAGHRRCGGWVRVGVRAVAPVRRPALAAGRAGAATPTGRSTSWRSFGRTNGRCSASGMASTRGSWGCCTRP